MKAANSPAHNPIFSYEVWLDRVLSVVQAIADRKRQEEVWPNPNFSWEQPNELVNSLFDDCLFEAFVERNQQNFTAEQRASSNDLLHEFQGFLAATPETLDPIDTLTDPRWQSIRSSAARFTMAFASKLPKPSS